MDIGRLKKIAQDIISDDEWVNDSHEQAEHNGIRNGLERLLNHLQKTEPSDVEKFSQTSLYIWFNNFVDFVQEYDDSVYDYACKYANKQEDDE